MTRTSFLVAALASPVLAAFLAGPAGAHADPRPHLHVAERVVVAPAPEAATAAATGAIGTAVVFALFGAGVASSRLVRRPQPRLSG